MHKEFLECGKIVSTHGLRGELKVEPWSDSPDFLADFKTVYLGEEKKTYAIQKARAQKNMLVLKLAGIDTLDDALAFRGKILYINREDAPLAEGEFFVQDLLGLSVVNADTGGEYGKLSDVFFTGANDVYELTAPDGEKKLFPAIKDVMIETDIEGGVMRIRPLKGLFDHAD